MRGWLALFAFLLCSCVGPARITERGPDASEAHRAALHATLHIITDNGHIGSGIAWDKDTIVTAGHVLAGASGVVITNHRGQVCRAQEARMSLLYDLAIIDVSGCMLHPLKRASAAAGATVWACGHPIGLEWSLSKGVVMAKRGPLMQFDASVNPGNSGGPIVDRYGRLVGMAVAISTVDGRFAGIAWALSVEAIESVVGD